MKNKVLMNRNLNIARHNLVSLVMVAWGIAVVGTSLSVGNFTIAAESGPSSGADFPIVTEGKDIKETSIDVLLMGYYIWAKPEYIDLCRKEGVNIHRAKREDFTDADPANYPVEYLKQFHVIVVSGPMEKPWDLNTVRELEALTNRGITPVFSLPEEINTAIDVHYKSSQYIESKIAKLDLSTFKQNGNYLDISALRQVAMTDSIIKLCHSIILYALRERATDIHIEPREDYVSIRFRIDGKLQEMLKLPKEIKGAVSSRFKIICSGTFNTCSITLGFSTLTMEISCLKTCLNLSTTSTSKNSGKLGSSLSYCL